MPSPSSVREREISFDDLAKGLRSTTRVRVPAGASLNKIGGSTVRSDSLVGRVSTWDSAEPGANSFVAAHNDFFFFVVLFDTAICFRGVLYI